MARRASVAAPVGEDAASADEYEEFLLNLTVDGVREGAYMLCKHADDLLGHHARQAFREKAASMRAENSVYYFLKELMRAFGSQQHAPKRRGGDGEPPALVLEAHEFRKLVASDPAFESAVPSDQVDALFYRIVDQDAHQKLIRHQDFLEFCLLDQDQLRLLLFKYRRHIKKMRLTDNEVADTFRRLSATGSVEMSPELFHAALRRDLDVVLTTGEVAFLMQLMDSDCDGVVKVNDFESFLKDDKGAIDLLHAPKETGVVDLKLSVSEAEETSLRREGFTQLFPALHETGRMFLWYRAANKDEGKSALSCIKYSASSRDTELVAKGFTCLQQDVNRQGAFGKHKYIWMSFMTTSSQIAGEIIDLSLTCGSLSDQHDARLWIPRHRGFKLVSGNLNEKSTKSAVFLWLRRRRSYFKEDLVDHQMDLVTVESPRSRVASQSHIDELEQQVRKTLRRSCPIDQDCSLNFVRLFDEFDPKKTRAIAKQAALVGIETFGIKMNKKDFAAIWERMNPFGTRQIDVVTFSQFLELTDAEIDEMLSTLQRGLTARMSYQVPNYRLIFQSYNALGDGKLSRADFQRIFATNQLSFTSNELGKVIQRFDVNNDGVVDYTDFLKYITGECDASARAASRIADAAEEVRAWAIERQSKKLAKEGNIDSSAAWKLLKPKHGKIDAHAVDHVLRQRNTRLDAKGLQLLMVLMAPATNGSVSQAAFHVFVNHLPKKVGGMVYEVKKLVGFVQGDGEVDTIFNKLNLESNGKLPITKFSQQINTLAVERGIPAFDLKDMVYLIQWTGAYCTGDGTVLIDRFLASVRENRERRNMKSEFITHYDSPKFLEGVSLLREEFKRCAKTPDGKYNFLIPFRLFDKDNSGQIALSELEAGIRELGVGSYLSDQEIKGLMRRFDSNSSGAIDYHEFLRFNLAESSSSSSRRLSVANQPDISAQTVIEEIITGERLSTANIEAYCASLKRMFGIIDKDTTGIVPVGRFVEVLKEMGISLDTADLEALLHSFRSKDEHYDGVYHMHFCDALVLECERRQEEQFRSGLPPTELLELLRDLFQEYNAAQQRSKALGRGTFNLHDALGVSKDSSEYVPLSIEDFKEVLWTAGVRHPYLRDELESIMSCFQTHRNSAFDVKLFGSFLTKGTRALVEVTDGALDAYVVRFQEELENFLSTGKDAGDRLLAMFAELDTNSNGTISHEEFLGVLQKVGLHHFLPPEDERLLMNFLDTNGDGTVSYQELLDFTKHAGEKLNAAAALAAPPPPASPTSPPPASPPPATKPDSPSRAADTPPPSPPSSPISSPIVFPREHLVVMHQIWKLNKKLSPAPFPFDKYFRKYRSKPDESCVKTRVFEKIIDKFLGRLVEKRVAYNMKEVDVDTLVRIFAPKRGADSINYENFLAALAQAQCLPSEKMSRSDSDSDASSENSDDALSCSSDEGDRPSERKFQAARSTLSKKIQREYESQKELQSLKAQVLDLMKDFKEKPSVGEPKMFKTLVTLGLRLQTREAKLILSAISGTGSAKGKYDMLRLLEMIQQHVDSALGVSSSKAVAESKPKKESAKPANGGSDSAQLNPTLAEKMYQCFILAAQRNVSGLKLLEKCDTKKTGKVTLLEFQTVLRLMGCTLTDSELDEVKKLLGDGATALIHYDSLVVRLRQDQKAPARENWSNLPEKLHTHRPAPLQVPSSPAAAIMSIHQASVPIHREVDWVGESVRSSMSPDEAKRVDSFLRQFFGDLLQTRAISSHDLLQMFESYDRKDTGFISVDAFRAVMRRCDVSLTADLLSGSVLPRFTSVAADKFDYVDFCETILGAAKNCRADIVAQHPPQAVFSTPAKDQLGSAVAPAVQRTNNGHSSARDARLNNAACLSGTFERIGVTLPALDTDAANRKSNEPRLGRPSGTDSGRLGSGWTCPVCFHKQTQPTMYCEICAAQDPSSVETNVLVQCLACGFRNRIGTITCDLCTSDLDPVATTRSHQSDVAAVGKPIPYDEGWIN